MAWKRYDCRLAPLAHQRPILREAPSAAQLTEIWWLWPTTTSWCAYYRRSNKCIHGAAAPSSCFVSLPLMRFFLFSVAGAGRRRVVVSYVFHPDTSDHLKEQRRPFIECLLKDARLSNIRHGTQLAKSGGKVQGHDMQLQKSQWVKASSDASQQVKDTLVTHSPT